MKIIIVLLAVATVSGLLADWRNYRKASKMPKPGHGRTDDGQPGNV